MDHYSDIIFIDENLLVDVLPTKMKTDLFLSVHMETLEQVSLFKVGLHLKGDAFLYNILNDV